MQVKASIAAEKDKRIEYIRTVACIGVVGIHVLKSAHDIFTDLPLGIMVLCTFLVNNLRWCVPIFLMITGSLLLEPTKELSLSKIGHYIWRITVVLAVFGTCFAMLELVFDQRTLTLSMIPQAVMHMLAGDSWDHLWYLYTLIMLYCFLPVMRAIISSMKPPMLIFTCIMMALYTCVLPTLRALGINIGLPSNAMSVYMLYMLIGYIIKKKIVVINKKVAFAGFIVCTAFLGGVAVLSEVSGENVDNALTSHASVAVIIQSVCLFTLLQNIREIKNERINKAILSLADASFGIYILHMVYINIFYKVIHLSPGKYTAAILLLVFLLTLLLSYGTVVLMKKIPIVKKFL